MKFDGIAQYSQPSFYRFSDDSTKLAKYVSDNFPMRANTQVLDLCAGCGVIGLEILSRSSVSLALTALEIEKDYRDFFIANSELLDCREHQVQFLCRDFSVLSGHAYSRRFDLIVCNPPYFDMEKNRLSSDPRKAKCRNISAGERAILIRGIENSLSLSGRCYVLARKDESLAIDLKNSEALDCRVVEQFGEVLLIKALLNID